MHAIGHPDQRSVTEAWYVEIPTARRCRQPLAHRLHPDNPHYFLWRGKPTVLVTSAEHYGALLNLDFDYVRYLDELHRSGLNHTRTFSGVYREIPGSFGITENPLAPKTGPLHLSLAAIR